jgi:hypothetical protein
MRLMRIGLFVLVFLAATRARAQINIIGPGSTPIGDMERGAGIMAAGAGTYNYYTAVGDSIEADTWMRLNEYVFQSVRQASMRERQRILERATHNRERYNKILERILRDPEFKDVRRGDALNAVYQELTDPQISESAFRLTPVQLPGELIRSIPFFYAKEDSTISLRRLTARGAWPVGLRGPELAASRKAYERAVDAALEAQLEGKLSHQAILAIETAVANLSYRLDQVITPSRDKVYLEARNFVKQLEATTELFKRKEIETILGEIDKYSGTTVHDLVVFMKRNNLRFAVAEEIGDEQSIYTKLYAALNQQLDSVHVPRSDAPRNDPPRGEVPRIEAPRGEVPPNEAPR